MNNPLQMIQDSLFSNMIDDKKTSYIFLSEDVLAEILHSLAPTTKYYPTGDNKVSTLFGVEVLVVKDRTNFLWVT